MGAVSKFLDTLKNCKAGERVGIVLPCGVAHSQLVFEVSPQSGLLKFSYFEPVKSEEALF